MWKVKHMITFTVANTMAKGSFDEFLYRSHDNRPIKFDRSFQHFLRVKLHCNIKISAGNHFLNHFQVVSKEYFSNKSIVHEHSAEVFINHFLTRIYSDNLKKTDIHGKVAAIIMSVK